MAMCDAVVFRRLAPSRRCSITSHTRSVLNVRLWPKADMGSCAANVRFQGKADILDASRNARSSTKADTPEFLATAIFIEEIGRKFQP